MSELYDPSSENGRSSEPKTESLAPRAFLSYSWDGVGHEEWVAQLAARLQGNDGVEILFDQWHLHPGDDKLHFMETSVAKSDFVIVVCTPNYAQRANTRRGGAGYESMIITAELADDILTNKFIPVLREGDWKTALPRYVKSRMGVNLCGNPYAEKEYEKLLRVLHGQPIEPPPLASKPVFSQGPAADVRAGLSELNRVHDQPKSEAFSAREAKDGAARFRANNVALGEFWNIMPFSETLGYEVFLEDGPAIWLRMLPKYKNLEEPTHEDLLKCGLGPNIALQPMSWSSFDHLRAEDGIGVYAVKNNLAREAETNSVAFAFETGELWCIDTGILKMTGTGNLYFLDIARLLMKKLRGYGEFLQCLGNEAPFNWIAGIEGVKGWRLQVPPPENYRSTTSGQSCPANVVIATGTFDPSQSPAMALRPFFVELFKKCGGKIPEHIEALLRSHQNF